MDLTRYGSTIVVTAGFYYQNLCTTYFNKTFGASTCNFKSIITAIYSLNFSPKRTVVGGEMMKNVMRNWIATVAAAGFGPGVGLGPAFVNILLTF